MENKDLFQKTIRWEKHESNERFFYHYDDSSLILLRINNFPDEHLYTLINGLNIVEIDDIPHEWSIV